MKEPQESLEKRYIYFKVLVCNLHVYIQHYRTDAPVPLHTRIRHLDQQDHHISCPVSVSKLGVYTFIELELNFRYVKQAGMGAQLEAVI